jgi:hypothetical protein
MPSAQDWAKILPSCRSVNYDQSCSLSFGGQKGPLFTCNDPEFNVKKYPQGCMNPNDNVKPTPDEKHVNNNNNNNNNDGNNYKNHDKFPDGSDFKCYNDYCVDVHGKKYYDKVNNYKNHDKFPDGSDFKCYNDYCVDVHGKKYYDKVNNNNNKNTNDTKGKITVGYGDLGLYRGTGKIVIKNEDTGKTLVTHDLNFAKQRDSQGDKCCVKTYTFDSSLAHDGDQLKVIVTGGGGSWEDVATYKNNLRMGVILDEIGEDENGNDITSNNNDNNDNNKKSNNNNNNNDNKKDNGCPKSGFGSDADFCGDFGGSNDDSHNYGNDYNYNNEGNLTAYYNIPQIIGIT